MRTKLLTGPMFASKTRRMVVEMEKYILANKKVMFISPKKDIRETDSHSSFVSQEFNSILNSPLVWSVQVSTQREAIDWLKANHIGASAVFVDEYFMIDFDSGFFHSIEDMVWEEEPTVIFAGLISDAKCKLFPTAEKVLPFFDEIEKTTAICMNCGKPANYSYFAGTGFNPDKINIDNGNYKCLCFSCYKKEETTNGL